VLLARAPCIAQQIILNNTQCCPFFFTHVTTREPFLQPFYLTFYLFNIFLELKSSLSRLRYTRYFRKSYKTGKSTHLYIHIYTYTYTYIYQYWYFHSFYFFSSCSVWFSLFILKSVITGALESLNFNIFNLFISNASLIPWMFKPGINCKIFTILSHILYNVHSS